MTNKRKSPHKLTFRLEDGSFAISRLDPAALTPKLARSLYCSGYREYKERGKGWRWLTDRFTEDRRAEA